MQLWAATRTRIRLRVKSPVAGVAVFAIAIDTHSEFLHRCVGTIVRQRFDNGEARTAIGAVGEGITKATVSGIENLADTVGTSGDVRENEHGLAATLLALPDLESAVINRIEEGRFETLNGGAGRFFFFQTQQKPI